MPPLLVLGPARCDKELAHARAAEAMERTWARAWHAVFAQCIGLALLGYVVYGISWGSSGDRATLLATGGFLVGYVVPLLRLLVFFLRHADQF